MGASVYYYFTPYQESIEAALQALREQEFRAGRYDAAMRNASRLGMLGFPFPPDANSLAPGPIHATLREAFLDAATDGSGTCSILDLFQVTSLPETCAASPFTEDQLNALFGTPKPNREEIKARLDWRNTDEAVVEVLCSIARGQGRYAIVYDGDASTEIFFIGYSFD
jgi:hypothetical protein